MKLFKVFLVCIFLVGTSTIAMADLIWFDADGAGGAYAPVKLDEVSGEAYGWYNVITALGADGILNNGDTFTESFSLDIIKGNLSGATQVAYDFLGPNYEVYADLSNLSGNVFNHSDGGTDTTAYTPQNILDDNFQISVTSGTADFYFDNSNDGIKNGVLIGSFAVTYGESTTYLPTGNQTLTASVGLTLQATALNPGYFFTDDGGSLGTDISTVDPISMFLALADQSNNLIIFAGNDNGTDWLTNHADDSLIVTVDDNGTDVEFEVVHEPATMLLIGVGLIGIAALRRKKA